MPDDDEKPDAMEDVKKGLGLLFRAAKTAVKKLPTEPIERVVLDGAKEVGRAVENVASTLEKEVFRDRPAKKDDAPKDAPPDDAPTTQASAKPAEPERKSTPPDDAPKGPRVG
jgi:hypothetical protein